MRVPRRLPPFSALNAFDAVARHGSFSRAALELNVSQPAVSRRVAALEADLGTPMFGRDTRPLRLTADGRRLFEVLRASLSRLEQVVQEIRGARPGQKIVLGRRSGLRFVLVAAPIAALAGCFCRLQLAHTHGRLHRRSRRRRFTDRIRARARLERRPHSRRERVCGLQPRVSRRTSAHARTRRTARASALVARGPA